VFFEGKSVYVSEGLDFNQNKTLSLECWEKGDIVKNLEVKKG
jgi:hypothetical protein